MWSPLTKLAESSHDVAAKKLRQRYFLKERFLREGIFSEIHSSNFWIARKRMEAEHFAAKLQSHCKRQAAVGYQRVLHTHR